MNNLFIVIMVCGIIFAGCAKKQVVSSPETQQAAGQQEQTKPTEKITEQKVEKITAEDIKKKASVESAEIFKDVYFNYDRYDIREDALPVLKSVANYAMKNQAQKVLIEGHCDDRGTNEYNLALGDRRAQSIKNYLLSLGVSSSRMEVISYGEEKPLCAEQTENCWARNRRAHFVMAE